MRSLASTPATARLFAAVLHHIDQPILRRSGGRRSFTAALTGMPVVEVTTTGARTGLARTHPLVGVPSGNGLVLVASNFGQQHDPAWYHNLKAHPRCTIGYRGQRQEMTARETEGPERELLWQRCLEVYPTFTKYAQWASHRHIPVLLLEPVATNS